MYIKYGVSPFVKTTYGKAEVLSSQFSENSFDIVTAQNSLDHSENPLMAIKEMIVCTKRGGWVILNHNANEGERENYEGFHQWNFHVEQGMFYISDRQKNIWNVANELQFVEVVVNSPDNDDWVQVHIQKK